MSKATRKYPKTARRGNPQVKRRPVVSRNTVNAKKGNKPLSRKMIVQLLGDLCKRLHRQEMDLAAIATTNAPNDLHTVAEHRLKTVTGMLLDRQAHDLGQISGFAEIIHARAQGLPCPTFAARRNPDDAATV